jgi:hypothetical protein
LERKKRFFFSFFKIDLEWRRNKTRSKDT